VNFRVLFRISRALLRRTNRYRDEYAD